MIIRFLGGNRGVSQEGDSRARIRSGGRGFPSKPLTSPQRLIIVPDVFQHLSRTVPPFRETKVNRLGGKKGDESSMLCHG